MKFRSIKYYFAEAFANLFKNRLMTFASIITVFSCTFMIIITYFIASNIDFFLEQFEKKLDVEIFFENYLTDMDISQFEDEISNMEHVAGIQYVSYLDAVNRYKDIYGTQGQVENKSNVISEITSGILPRSFIITIDNSKNIDFLYEKLSIMKNRGVFYPESDYTLDVITSVNTAIRIISVIIILFLLGNSIVIIVNTVKLTVNNRKYDINIMKYVGATDWFIKWPFIIEGALIGFIGSSIPVVMGVFGYSRITEYIFEQFKVLKDVVEFRSTIAVFSVLAPACIALGLLVGIIGSSNAVKKYLNV
jgi:cell division transport system permease protein